MSYSTLKKALQLFEEPVSNQKHTHKKTATKSPRFKSKSKLAKSVFKVPNFVKSDAGKSILRLKEQIKNEKEINLVKLNLERLHKLDQTSCLNNIASNLIKQRMVSEKSNNKKEDSTVFTDEDFEKFEREYFQS